MYEADTRFSVILTPEKPGMADHARALAHSAFRQTLVAWDLPHRPLIARQGSFLTPEYLLKAERLTEIEDIADLARRFGIDSFLLLDPERPDAVPMRRHDRHAYRVRVLETAAGGLFAPHIGVFALVDEYKARDVGEFWFNPANRSFFVLT